MGPSRSREEWVIRVSVEDFNFIIPPYNTYRALMKWAATVCHFTLDWIGGLRPDNRGRKRLKRERSDCKGLT